MAGVSAPGCARGRSPRQCLALEGFGVTAQRSRVGFGGGVIQGPGVLQPGDDGIQQCISYFAPMYLGVGWGG